MTARTVRITHPTKGESMVTEEVAAYQVRHGWSRSTGPAPKPTPDPEAAAQPAVDASTGDMPAKAAELIAWIGTDPDRAARALTAEQALGNSARSTVLDHIAKVTAEANPDPEAAASTDTEA